LRDKLMDQNMKRIILADDDESFRFTFARMLEDAGYEVVEAANGKEALRRFREFPAADLVICDIIMPEMEGTETIQELLRSNPDVRIIAMSGGGRINARDYLKLAQRMGAKQTLAKPFSSDEALVAIERLIGPGVPSRSSAGQ